MDRTANRLIAGISLVALFGVLSLAGSGAGRAQTTQNVLVTNTPSQQVPVLPAARPGPGGAYIVAVSNTPGVSIKNTAVAPVVTKEVNDADANNFTYFTQIVHAPGLSSGSATFQVPKGMVLSIDTLAVDSIAANADESSNLVEVTPHIGPTEFGVFPVLPTPVTGFPARTTYSGNPHIYAPGGSFVLITVQRHAFTGSCSTDVSLTGHLVNYP